MEKFQSRVSAIVRFSTLINMDDISVLQLNQNVTSAAILYTLYSFSQKQNLGSLLCNTNTEHFFQIITPQTV